MSPKGVALVKSFEGCKLEAYQDIVGVWTIGYGETQGVFPGQKITQAQADDMLTKNLDTLSTKIAKLCTRPPVTQEMDAMTSLAYNIGLGAFSTSSVLRYHNQGAHDLAGAAFLLWNKAGGKVVAGLQRRREAEKRLYLS